MSSAARSPGRVTRNIDGLRFVRDSVAVARPKPRRTQAQRSADTQDALLNAAVECLIDLGYRGTTTTEVARRAGVSLGAMLHHFPTKADLLAAAVAHVMRRRQKEFQEAIVHLRGATQRLDAAIGLLWEGISGPTFLAWVELWVGARTDPDLTEALREMDDEYDRVNQTLLRELFPHEVYPDTEALEVAMRFAVSLMDGLALRALVVQPIDARPIELLRSIAHTMLDPAR